MKKQSGYIFYDEQIAKLCSKDITDAVTIFKQEKDQSPIFESPEDVSKQILKIISEGRDTFEHMDGKTSINDLRVKYFPKAKLWDIVDGFSLLRKKLIHRHTNEHYTR